MSDPKSSEHTLSVFRFDSEKKIFFQNSAQRELRAHEVLIRTTHASLCYTDVHAKHRGIGLGHEGVGIVEQVGEAVRSLQVGQRAGWGYARTESSCKLRCQPDLAPGGYIVYAIQSIMYQRKLAHLIPSHSPVVTAEPVWKATDNTVHLLLASPTLT